MHYVFEKDGMRTVVPCTKATMSRAYRAYRTYEWVEFDPKVSGITLAGNARPVAVVEPHVYVQSKKEPSQTAAIIAFLLILVLTGIAGGIECGLIPM